MPRRPVAVAITGGVGAGKSEALAAFARRGAAVASSDEIVHELLAGDEEVRQAIRARWGERAVGDRPAIAEIVFHDPDELAWLEALLHPRVLREYTRWREGLERSSEPPAVLVVEIPLLYETGGQERFDQVVVITAPDGVRDSRGRAAPEREQRLLPDEQKVFRADFSYVNDGSLEELDRFVADVLARLPA